MACCKKADVAVRQPSKEAADVAKETVADAVDKAVENADAAKEGDKDVNDEATESTDATAQADGALETRKDSSSSDDAPKARPLAVLKKKGDEEAKPAGEGYAEMVRQQTETQEADLLKQQSSKVQDLVKDMEKKAAE